MGGPANAASAKQTAGVRDRPSCFRKARGRLPPCSWHPRCHLPFTGRGFPGIGRRVRMKPEIVHDGDILTRSVEQLPEADEIDRHD